MQNNSAAQSTIYFAYFLDLPNEKIIFAKRQHWIAIIPKMLLFISIFFIICSICVLIFTSIFPSMSLLFLSLCLTISMIIALCTKAIADWHFHLYIFTNKKIVEVQYLPPFSHSISTVILDQVRCTEINQNNIGFLQTLWNVGDLVLTFDELTRKDTFVFKNIYNPRQAVSQAHQFFSSLSLPLVQQIPLRRKEMITA